MRRTERGGEQREEGSREKKEQGEERNRERKGAEWEG